MVALRRCALPLLVALALLPAASACGGGSVMPILDLHFAAEPVGRCFFGNETVEDQGCLALPEEPLNLLGTVTWGWNDLPCTAEALPPIEDVLITFDPKAPTWLSVSQPAPIRITPDEQLDPATYSVDASGEPRNAVAHRIVKPFSLTVSLAREPTELERADLADAGGVVLLLLRAAASESYGWRESFTVHDLRFDGRSQLAPSGAVATQGSEAVPLPLLALAALALAARLRR